MGDAGVYFYTGRFGHPLFEEQLGGAPEGFVYRSAESGREEASASGTRRVALHRTRLLRVRGVLERMAIRSLSRAGHVRRIALDPPPDCSLIHSAQHLVRGSPLPYVVDFECIEVFCLYQRTALRRPWARRRLLDAISDERCHFALPWSQAAKRGLGAALGPDAERVLSKTIVVLPAIRERVDRPAQRDGGPLRVLFIGTAFEAKGGVETIRALRQVRATHDVVLDVISDVPARWRSEIERSEGIVMHPWPAPAVQVKRLFQQAQLLLFPSHMDTFGFVMLEAMAHGVPVLATRHFATPEIVGDGVSGLLVEGENPLYGDDGLCRFDHTLPPPRSFVRSLSAPSGAYVSRLANALARVAEEPGLHERLAAGALSRVREGALSVGCRQEALARIYSQALGG